MALKAVVEDIEQVDEQLRDHYQEVEGLGWRLDVSAHESDGHLFALEDIAGLKQNAINLKREKTNALKTAGQAETELESLREELSSLQEKLESEDGDYKAQVEAARNEAQKKIQSLEEQYKSEKQQLYSQLGDLVTKRSLGDALEKQLVRPESKDMLLAYAAQYVKPVEENGNWRPVVVDEQGNERTSSNPSSLDPMTLEEFAAELRKNHIYAFREDTAGGSDTDIKTSSPGNGSQHTKKVSLKELKNDLGKKVEFIEKHGQEAFEELLRAEAS